MTGTAAIEGEDAAAGDEEDDDCGRTAARLVDSVHEEDDGDETELPGLFDLLLVAGDDGGGGVQELHSTTAARVSWRRRTRQRGDELLVRGDRGDQRGASYPRGAGRGAAEEEQGHGARAASPRSLQREEGDDPAIFHITPWN